MQAASASVESSVSNEFDQPGAMSIVVQGPLSDDNLAETARNCQHWRKMFPNAQLILAISSGELAAAFTSTCDGEPTELSRSTSTRAALCDLIRDACEVICVADAAAPLPPIKSDTDKINSVNFQIAAAKAGLSRASGVFVLRVRSDLVFHNRHFLDQYQCGGVYPRGENAVTKARVLISWLYTLNPFTLERIPLHFSDWFHFGLLEDVRMLWDVRPMSLTDAVYYQVNSHAPGSSLAERRFRVKYAVEQYLIYEVFKSHVEGLIVEYHNDTQSTFLSLDILLDNFVLCDLSAAAIYFPKYDGEWINHEKKYHCITPSDWKLLIENRGVSPKELLRPKIEEALNRQQFERAQPFPREYDVARLRADSGFRLNREIVAHPGGTMEITGPGVSMPGGLFSAEVKFTTCAGPGTIVLKVVAEGGSIHLAERRFELGSGGLQSLSVGFQVSSDGVDQLEVVCRIDGLRELSVSSITIHEREGDADETEFPRLYKVDALQSKSGRHSDGEIIALGRDGTLLYGPYVHLPSGEFVVRLAGLRTDGPGTLRIRATANAGRDVLADMKIGLRSSGSNNVVLPFDVVDPDGVWGFEVVCSTAGFRCVRVAGIVLEERLATVQPRRMPAMMHVAARWIRRVRDRSRGTRRSN